MNVLRYLSIGRSKIQKDVQHKNAVCTVVESFPPSCHVRIPHNAHWNDEDVKHDKP